MLKLVLKFLFKVLFRVEVTGADPAKFKNKKTLIAANHVSFLDGALLWLFLPTNVTFMVHTTVLKNPIFRWLLGFVPHRAIDTMNPLGIRAAIKFIEDGIPVGIFPEGRITVTGSLMKVYDGSAFLAAKTGATVIPVRIQGAGRTYFSRLAGVYPRAFFPKLSLHVLEPTTMPMPELPTAKERRRRSGEQMRDLLMDAMVRTRDRTTLYEAYVHAMSIHGRKRDLTQDVREVEDTYGSLHKSMLGLGRWLERRTQPGERIGVLLANANPTVALTYAASMRGRVFSMMNFSTGTKGLRNQCDVAGITNIFTSRGFLAKSGLTETVNALQGVTLHYIEDAQKSLRVVDKAWVAYRMVFPRGAQVPVNPADPTAVLFTSGTEGLPKGVVHSHDSLLANVAQVQAMADFTTSDRFFVCLPMFHSFGLLAGALLPVLGGYRAFLFPSPLSYKLIPELTYDRNCTVLFGTNSFLAKYAKFAHPYDFAKLRYVIAGAEKLTEEVRNQWIDKFGIRVLEGYGVTECSPVISVNTPMASERGTVGRFVPGLQHRLIPVPGINADGQLLVKGPNVMAGYLKADKPGVLQPPEYEGEAGWYDTGDIVDVSDAGFIRIKDRAKRFAKLAGEMVSLSLVEDIARHASASGTHASSKRPDVAKGEAIVLFTTDKTLTRERVLAAAQALGHAEITVPRVIKYLDAIPVLGTGKTDYVTLGVMAQEAGPAATVAPTPTKSESNGPAGESEFARDEQGSANGN